MTRPMCIIYDCEKENHARGYCKAHYQQFIRNNKDIERLREDRRTKCTIYGCENFNHAKYRCEKHYKRFIERNKRTLNANEYTGFTG